jgi:hypothetical protein
MSHIWEHEHPYYWNEGNFFKNGWHFTYDSWAEFMAAWGDADDDLNLLCRWDWVEALDEDGNPESVHGAGTLKLGYVLQRKSISCSHHVKVGPEDEAAVRAWLQGKWKHMQALWAGTEGA